jgi:hypothetical protein
MGMRQFWKVWPCLPQLLQYMSAITVMVNKAAAF